MKSQAVKEVLSNVFKLSSFRGEQEAIILRTLEGHSSLVIMPTGMGKSLCYQLPSQILGGLTVVISPLIALMKDQVDQAQKLGLKATFINSSLNREERERRYKKLAHRDYEILYVTPERFRKADFKEALLKNSIQLLAIDEAHCISQWGHDFRPDYSKLKEIRCLLGNPPTQMLTATATPSVQMDIIEQLGFKKNEVQIFLGGIERPNLFVQMVDLYGWESKLEHLTQWLGKVQGPKIAYFSLVASLEAFARELEHRKISHLVYHGQMNARERKKNQDLFLNHPEGFILATPAFGLGIHKSDIRGIAHLELPAAIESYYQEIGRAGRDGKQAYAILLYDEQDIAIQMDFIKWTNPSPDFIRRTYRLIEKNSDRLQSEGLEYLRQQLNFYNSRDFRVETAVNLLEHWGFIRREEEGRRIWAIEEPSGEILDEKLFQARFKSQNLKLLDMVNLAKSKDCRKKIIYGYFGVESSGCGFCDNCLNRVS